VTASADGDGDGAEPDRPPAVAGDDARALLYDLVATPSPSGEEAAAAKRLAGYLAARDREVWLDDAGNVRAPADDAVLLTSHVDTVPGEPPVEVRETAGAYDEGPTLWGRGSVDATGPLAAMAAAAVETGVSFVGVTGEERTSRGARRLLEDRAAPEAVINGEPSGWDALTLGYRGLLSGRYVHTSESGHSSRPENNAIQDAVAWWARVERRCEAAAETPTFEQVTPKPVGIAGGPTDDGLAVEATMDVQLRVPPGRTVEDVRELAVAELGPGTVRWHDAVPPVMTSARTPVASAFRAAIRAAGGEPRLLRKTGTSDMNLYADRWDCPAATYGPGNSDLDHAPDEHLSLPAFDRAVGVLTAVCERLTD
jgi:LysW-gamma-L-lysine carboxypeptidase